MRKAIEVSALTALVSALLVFVAALQFSAGDRTAALTERVAALLRVQDPLPEQERQEQEAANRREAQGMVAHAIAYMHHYGRERLVAQVENPAGPFVRGSTYVSIIDLNGMVVAHGGNRRMIGRNISAIEDAEGRHFIEERLQLARRDGRGWQSYRYMNPINGRFQRKIEYFQLVDGWIVASGVFE